MFAFNNSKLANIHNYKTSDSFERSVIIILITIDNIETIHTCIEIKSPAKID